MPDFEDFPTQAGSGLVGPRSNIRVSRGPSGLVQSVDGSQPAGLWGDGLYAALRTSDGPQTSLTLGGLNGDADGAYEIHGRMNSAVGANTMSLVINDSQVNCWWVPSNDLIGGVLISVGWFWGQNGSVAPNWIQWSAGDYIEFWFTLHARSGRTRAVASGTKAIALKGGAQTTFTIGGEYLNAGANISRMGLLSNQANGLGVGSFLCATPKGSTNQFSIMPASATPVPWAGWADNTIVAP